MDVAFVNSGSVGSYQYFVIVQSLDAVDGDVHQAGLKRAHPVVVQFVDIDSALKGTDEDLV